MKQIRISLILCLALLVTGTLSFAQTNLQKELYKHELVGIVSCGPDDSMKNIFFWEDGEKLKKVDYSKSELTNQFVKKAEMITSYNVVGKEKYLLINFVYLPENRSAKIFAPKLDQTYLVKVDKYNSVYKVELYTLSKSGSKHLFKSFDSKTNLPEKDQQLLKNMIALM